MINVLLVAPNLGLEKAMDEVRSVSIALTATPLIGKVTRSDVINTIEVLQARQIDIIWFATHGDERGVMLSDGPLPTSDLTAIVRNTNAKLVVLNSCSSRIIGLELHDELGIDVICTQTAADDITAYQTGALLAANLAKGMTTRQAYEKSKPGQNVLYYLFENKGKEIGDDFPALIKMIREELRMVRESLDALRREVNLRIDQMQREIDERLMKMAVEYQGMDKRVAITEAISLRSSPVDKWVAITFFSVMLLLFIVYLWNNLK